MTDFKPGDKVKCVEGGMTLVVGKIYTFAGFHDKERQYLKLEEYLPEFPWHNFAVSRFIPSDPKPDELCQSCLAPLYEDEAILCGLCVVDVGKRQRINAMIDDGIAAANVSAIYAIQPQCHIPPKPVEQKPSDPRSEGIARAIGNLNQNEYRLGSSRWSPE
jgi:hypothetical protein